MKNYVGISRDHSGSMARFGTLALYDYNTMIADLKANTIRFGIDTVVSVVECGIHDGYKTTNRFAVTNSSIAGVKKITAYPANGNNTPLRDSVMLLIEQFEKMPDARADDVAFLLSIVTDGQDNSSKISVSQFAEKIKYLNSLDNWTITFRVPRGYKSALMSTGIPEFNIYEYNAESREEYKESTVAASAATTNFYATRSANPLMKKSTAFYAEVTADTSTVRRELSNISKKIRVVKVPKVNDGYKIQDFMEEKTGHYKLGTVFYQLTKREEVQDNKRFIVWDKNSGEYYTGAEARSLLKLPSTGTIKLVPGANDQFEVFVQSNSVNRKLVGGTKVIVYEPF